MFSEGQGSSGAPNGSPEQPTPPPTGHPPSDRLLGPDFVTRLEIISTRIPKSYITPFCGASAGVASGIVTCPLDVIKTKLQAQGGFARRSKQAVQAKVLYRGMLGTGTAIWRQDGIRGLYQGLGPMLLGYLPTWAVYMAVYDRSRDYYYERTGQYPFSSCMAQLWLKLFEQRIGGYHEDTLPSRQAGALQ